MNTLNGGLVTLIYDNGKELIQIRYDDYNIAMGQMKKTAQFHKMCRLIGHPGAGKTTLLMEFARTHENAYYICPSRSCRIREILRLMGRPIGYYASRSTAHSMILDLISLLNERGSDTIYLIDEADALCPHGHIDQIDKLDTLRYIWDHTRRHTSFIFAAPYDLEMRLQKSSEQISNSQFYRRCSIHTLKGMSLKAVHDYLHQIESEFHIVFEPAALELISKRIMSTERGGLGISREILEHCLMVLLPKWQIYYELIEKEVPREEALALFRDTETMTLSRALVENAMLMQH